MCVFVVIIRNRETLFRTAAGRYFVRTPFGAAGHCILLLLRVFGAHRKRQLIFLSPTLQCASDTQYLFNSGVVFFFLFFFSAKRVCIGWPCPPRDGRQNDLAREQLECTGWFSFRRDIDSRSYYIILNLIIIIIIYTYKRPCVNSATKLA